jgi:hypothetical protein
MSTNGLRARGLPLGLLPSQEHAVVVFQLCLGAERRSEAVEEVAQPSRVGFRRAGQPEPPDLHRNQACLYEPAALGIGPNQIHQAQVVSKLLIPTNGPTGCPAWRDSCRRYREGSRR